MAREKTMVAVSVCGSDGFLELSAQAQALYLQLNLSADGSGVVDCRSRVMRGMGVPEEAYAELERAGFVDTFTDGAGKPLCLILDWWVSNAFDIHHYFPGAYWQDVTALYCLSGPLDSGRDKARYVRFEPNGEVPRGCVCAFDYLQPRRARPSGDGPDSLSNH